MSGDDAGKGERNNAAAEEQIHVARMAEGEYLDVELRKRRAALAGIYDALPAYASPAFWQALGDPALPLEVLVRVLRVAIARQDEHGRRHICAELVSRTQDLNLAWARQALRLSAPYEDERCALAGDLCADLHECLLRALQDPQRHFWEENFLHALYFERKHVLRTFMIREGFWLHPAAQRGVRIPRASIASLDACGPHDWQDACAEIEDVAAQQMFLAVEQSDLLQAVLQLPEKFKAIILLLFWEGRTEKETARVLAISDRTVRNRLHKALQLLRALLPGKKEDSTHA